MERRNGHIYEFADFRLIPAEGLLLRNGSPVPLAPKAFSTLVLLVEQHGHLVEKTELIDQIWENAFVEEAAVSRCVWDIRNVLCEDPKNKKFIQTVPKRGYRFVADVSVIGDGANASNAHTSGTRQMHVVPNGTGTTTDRETDAPDSWVEAVKSPSKENGHENGYKEKFLPHSRPNGQFEQEAVRDVDLLTKRSGSINGIRSLFAATGLTLLLVGAIGLGYYFFSAGKSVLGGDGKRSFAVLPLKPINTANRDEIYEVGIADSLILKISSIKGFTVRPLSATRKYADIAQDPLVAGREQQVDYVLASNYQIAGGKIRVTAQLLNVAGGQIEESYTIEKDVANVFAMQDAIAGEIGKFLQSHFVVTSGTPAATRGTDNEEAYRLYLQGMYLADIHTLSTSQKAVKVLERAVELDPDYAQAWAGKAYSHRAVANFIGRSVSTHEDTQKSMEAIKRALSLDENLAEAYSTLCENKMYYEYDFVEAESACKRGIELNPNSPLAHQVYSRFLLSRGRFDEAITEIKTTIDLEPASLFYNSLYGINLYYARRYPEAIAQFKRVLAMDENFGNARYWLYVTLAVQGNELEAFELFMKWLAKEYKADEATIQAYRAAYQTSGWRGVMQEQAKRYEQSNERYFEGVVFNAQAGNKDKAFEYLEKSYQRREMWMAYLQVDPRLDPLRGDPRFDELVKRIGLK